MVYNPSTFTTTLHNLINSSQGVGGRLVEAALAKARTDKLTIVPWCPYARRWLQEHPDEARKVTIDWETPRPPK